jgi:hypothetical protein
MEGARLFQVNNSIPSGESNSSTDGYITIIIVKKKAKLYLSVSSLADTDQ